MSIENKLNQAIRLLTEIKMEMAKTVKQPLKMFDLVQSPQWPLAVETELICEATSNEDKKERAEGILDITGWDFQSKSFLDFGCGEGHTIPAAKKAAKAIGYDPAESGDARWEHSLDGRCLTTDFGRVQKEGTFDFILLYDVLDHTTYPQNVLNQAAALLSPGGMMFVRNHPWISRHGGHLYRHLNKAFVHILLSKEELKTLNVPVDETVQKIIHPKGTYESWFKSAGLTKVRERLHTEPVERFFQTGIAKQKFDVIYAESRKKGWKPEHNYTFMDYVLTKD